MNEVFLRADGTADYQSIDIRYRDINSIKVRRNNSVRKGTIIGTLAGLTLSAISAVALYSDPGALENVLLPVVAFESALFIGIGTGLGAGIGTIKKSTPVKEDPIYFKENIQLLRKYVNESGGEIE